MHEIITPWDEDQFYLKTCSIGQIQTWHDYFTVVQKVAGTDVSPPDLDRIMVDSNPRLLSVGVRSAIKCVTKMTSSLQKIPVLVKGSVSLTTDVTSAITAMYMFGFFHYDPIPEKLRQTLAASEHFLFIDIVSALTYPAGKIRERETAIRTLLTCVFEYFIAIDNDTDLQSKKIIFSRAPGTWNSSQELLAKGNIIKDRMFNDAVNEEVESGKLVLVQSSSAPTHFDSLGAKISVACDSMAQNSLLFAGTEFGETEQLLLCHPDAFALTLIFPMMFDAKLPPVFVYGCHKFTHLDAQNKYLSVNTAPAKSVSFGNTEYLQSGIVVAAEKSCEHAIATLAVTDKPMTFAIARKHLYPFLCVVAVTNKKLTTDA